MPFNTGRRRRNGVATQWWPPALVTLVAVATAVAVVHRHRDAGSVFAAVLCLVFAAQAWWAWQRAHRPRRHSRLRDLDD